MKDSMPLVITISRQLGCGGASIGQEIAEQLGISYVDRDFIKLAANELNIDENELEQLDEKGPTWLDKYMMRHIRNMPFYYSLPEEYKPTEKSLLKIEENIIRKIAKDHSAIIVGRCGGYILKDHPRHLSVFLFADEDFRIKRICEINNVDAEVARKQIEECDKARERYHLNMTGRDWYDARQYKLSMDTGRLGTDEVRKLILNCVIEKYGAQLP
ncbi:MAG: cytidylate kinase-like family protein [Clostridiales bacterium]|nr:cytidylate kinase-like family protein [Clostridiales bacterium]